MVFTSSDKLHAKNSSAICEAGPSLSPSVELKADLQRLDAHLSAQPPAVLERGVVRLDPPFDTSSALRFLEAVFARLEEPRGERGDVEDAHRRPRLQFDGPFNAAVEAPGSRAGRSGRCRLRDNARGSIRPQWGVRSSRRGSKEACKHERRKEVIKITPASGIPAPCPVHHDARGWPAIGLRLLLARRLL